MFEFSKPYVRPICKCAQESHARIFEVCSDCPVEHDGIDIEKEIMVALSQEISKEIDRKVLNKLRVDNIKRCYE